MINQKIKNSNWKFKLGKLEEYNSLCRELNCSIEGIEETAILSEPVKTGNLMIPNSLAVHPMEGADGDAEGRPGKLTVRRYNRFASGGAGLIWAEATAVVPEGRANPRQLWLNEESKGDFAEMIKQMKSAAKNTMGSTHNPVIVAQLTHSGRYSKPGGFAEPIIPEKDPYRDALTPQAEPDRNQKSRIPDDWPIVTDEYLDNLQDAYVKAAALAFEVGFDAVDIKSCHGYLINELFASRNRKGRYGGSFENRTRFLLEVIDKIQAGLSTDKAICLRLGFYDAIPYPYGWGVDENDYTKPDLTEPKKLLKLLIDRGIKLINFTIANPYYNPHFGRPFNQPIVGAYPEPEHPLKGVERLINLAGEIQKDFPEIALVGTGYSWLRQLMPNVAAAAKAKGKVTIVGAGRMAFAYPDFAKDLLLTGQMDKNKVCVGCSACTQLMRDGQTTGCVIRDNKVYGPIFRHGRMSDKSNLQRLAQNCMQCQEPTCQLACPACINIPEFIQKFLDGDDKGAYETIRKVNILPEVCAWLCPVEQQCQGNCLGKFIADGSLPIADIQRYLAEQANRNGWSKIKIPEKATGKNIALIGAGPVGIAAAAVLLEAGHSVTIFDKNKDFGGLIESVIPPMRQSQALKNEINSMFQDIPDNRMDLRLGKELNESFNLDDIMSENFDAALIGMGLPKAISSFEQKLQGLYDSLEFLALAKKSGKVDVLGKRVAVIGGGNTAIDAAITAVELGAKDVYVIYRRSFREMPAWSAERDKALNENVHFLILTQQVGYISQEEKLTGIKVCPTKLGEYDDSRRRKPIPIETSSYILDMDIVVEAIGQQLPKSIEKLLPGVELTKGFVKVKPNSYETSIKGVFAGGDIIRGASTVVEAVVDGMKAAEKIDKFLSE
ncbi:MAG: oxidoreductase [Planctomycetota bacterium]|jgi:NADPH-dependent glutamate synthase beta subunit-like oxidoreductase/2,4-dienoyl-CoA reductase-like NADH-dependent reductase (Old Yellow Enzyme family)